MSLLQDNPPRVAHGDALLPDAASGPSFRITREGVTFQVVLKEDYRHHDSGVNRMLEGVRSAGRQLGPNGRVVFNCSTVNGSYVRGANRTGFPVVCVTSQVVQINGTSQESPVRNLFLPMMAFEGIHPEDPIVSAVHDGINRHLDACIEAEPSREARVALMQRRVPTTFSGFGTPPIASLATSGRLSRPPRDGSSFLVVTARGTDAS